MDTTKNIAALFDFDGVVMDTETQYSVFWDELGRRYHPEIKDFGRVIKGQTLTQIYDKYFAGMDNIQKKITADLNNFEKGMLYEYIPGVENFMKELRVNGIKIAIVTSSNEQKMSNAYRVHPELKANVDFILTAEMFTHSKPDPECFLLGAKVCDLYLCSRFIKFKVNMAGYISGDTRKVTTHRLVEMKQRGERISMLTSYDYTTAQIVDEAGIDVILVGDSASNVMAGNVTTLPITLDQVFQSWDIWVSCLNPLINTELTLCVQRMMQRRKSWFVMLICWKMPDALD